MPTKDPRIDAYIKNAPDFAQPILRRLRELVHEGCPDVVETIKWSMPAFEHRGPFCGMAAFKAHCAFGFWKSARLIRKAAKLNEDGVKLPSRTAKRAALPVPPDLAAALKKCRKAAATFDAFSPSCRREYVEWIVEAKRDDTRQRRIATAIEWMAEGKQRNWKYQAKR